MNLIIRANLLTLLFLLSIQTIFSQNVKWANSYGGSGADFTYFSIANDGNGNVYNSGSFSATANFGSIKLQSSGGIDNYVQKIRPDGSTEWCNKIGSTIDEGQFNSITVDCNNNIFVTGQFSGTCTFYGTNSSSFTLTSGGSYDAYIVKYNPMGVVLDARRIVTGSGDDKTFKIIMDNECNIYITGSYGGNSGSSANFGGIIKTNSGIYDMFLLKLDQNLNQLWVNTAGSAADDLGSYLAVDSNNNVYVVTQFWLNLSFSNSPTTLTHAAGGNWDAALIKYNSNGNFIWAQKFASTGHETCNGLVITKTGKIYWVGGYQGVTTFSSASGGSYSLTSNGGTDAVIIQYDLNGTVLKIKGYGGAGSDYFRGIALSKNQDSLTVVGTYQNTVNFTTTALTSIGGTGDVVVMVLDTACNAINSYSYGGPAYDEATDVVCDNKNNIYIIGYYNTSMRFENKNFNSYGGTDLFIAKLFNRDNLSDTCINCATFQFNGLIACYPFTGNTNDQTSNGFNGTGNGITPSPNRFGRSNEAYSYDGNDDIDFSNAAFKLGNYSYTGWVYLDTIPTATGQQFTILSIGGDTFSQILSLNYVSSTLSTWNLTSPGILSNMNLSFASNPTLRQWYFVSIIRDSFKTTLYINQDSATSQTSASANGAKYNNSNYKCTIGSNKSASNTFFKGRIDDIRIYNYALSKTEIAKIYSSSNGLANVEAGENRVRCSGTSVALMATGALDYSWSPATGLSATNIFNPIATPSVTTTYYVVGSNGNCSSKDSVTVTIPPIFTMTSSVVDSICAGDTVILTASSSRKSYLWSTGATSQSIKVAPLVTTSYSVTGKTDCCKDSLTKTIFIKNILVDAGPNQTKCKNTGVQLQATGATNYLWSPSTGLSSTTIANPIANPLVTTTYYVNGTSASGNCVSNDSITITVNPPFSILGATVDTICIFDSIIINSTAGRNNYNWSNGAKTQSIKVSPNITTQYTLISSLNGCTDTAFKTIFVINNQPYAGLDVYICGNKSTQLNATGSSNYLWTPSAGLSNSTIANPIAKPSVTTSYILKGTTLFCNKYDTVIVFVNPILSISSVKDTICFGDSIMIESSLADSYIWNSGQTTRSIYVKPSTTQTYRVIATLHSCPDTAFKTIVVNKVIVDAGANQTRCYNSSVQLLATGANSYIWSPNTGLSATNISNPIATPNSNTTYFVTGILNGCSNSDSVTVFVNPPFSILASKDTICKGDTVNIFASNGRTSYLWNNGSTTSSIKVSPQATTSYKVISNLNGCIDTLIQTIFVKNCVGINSKSSFSELKIYPNPSNGEITISLPQTGEKFCISVLSSEGKLINQQIVTDKTQLKINLKLASGIYLMNIKSDTINAIEKVVIE